jgi:hypothetical protein
MLAWSPNTGAKYDPATFSWESMSTENSPVRTGPAVWADGQMIVWGGGSRFSGGSNLGGAYVLAGNFADADEDGFTRCAGDCDDSMAGRYPGAPEMCNGLDDDCDDNVPVDEADADGDGFAACAGDCDDLDAAVNPGTEEICNGADQNCDGIIDEIVTTCGAGQCTATGFCSAGVDDCVPGTPAPEVCNGLDDDCDGSLPADEADADGDSVPLCAGDCDDEQSATFPNAVETNDGLDNQCAGEPGSGWIDEISGLALLVDAGTFCWEAQAEAQYYQVVRARAPEAALDCVQWIVADPCSVDVEQPMLGEAFYYSVRSVLPFVGSWGGGADGGERVDLCVSP